MATNNSTNQPQSDYRPEANYENPDAVSAKDRMLILTIVIVLLVLAAMAVLGFLFIKQGRHSAGTGRRHRDKNLRETAGACG